MHFSLIHLMPMGIPTRRIGALALAFCVWSFCTISAQNISGYIYGDTKEPLVYATIGLLHTDLGTITDQEGFFKLDLGIAGTTASEELLISHIGYESKAVSVAHFKAEDTLYLKKKVFELNEIVIEKSRFQKGKKRRWGYYSKKKNVITGWNSYAKGEESGLIVRNDKKVRIDSIGFHLAHLSYEYAQFRLRVRSVANGKPNEDILTENYYLRVDDVGSHSFNLQSTPLWHHGSFYVGLELVSIGKAKKKPSGKHDKIALSGKFLGKMCYKKGSTGKWLFSSNVGPSIQVYGNRFN